MRFFNRLLLILLLVTLLLLAAACSESVDGQVDDSPVSLRVMSFNIEWGGTNVSFENVVEAIRLADVDIVGIQEAEGNLARLAGELGWYYRERSYVISRFPIFETSNDGRIVHVEIQPGKVVAISNVHLTSDPYGPYAIRDGDGVEAALSIEAETRLPEIHAVLESLVPLQDQDIPLFVTGDFNAPSHTDWVEATVGTRPFLTTPVEWPVSRAMSDAGFRDTWRQVYPDPVTHPGLTWWAGRPALAAYAPGENDPQDRIDFIWFAGPVSVDSVDLVGEAGFPGVTTSVMPWPSDHRAVVGEFLVLPSDLPDFIDTAQRVYRQGMHVDVRFNHARDTGLYVSVWRAGDSPELIEKRINNGSGHSVFDAALFEPGHYRAELSNADQTVSLDYGFWVLPLDAMPRVTVGASQFQPGEGISIQWQNAPGFRNDYVAVYEAETEAGYENALVWAYIDSIPNGQMQLDAQSARSGWPLAPGRYRVRLIKDDGYVQLAESAEFIVVE